MTIFFRPKKCLAGTSSVTTIANPPKIAPATKYGGKIVVCQPGINEIAKSVDTTEWTDKTSGVARAASSRKRMEYCFGIKAVFDQLGVRF